MDAKKKQTGKASLAAKLLPFLCVNRRFMKKNIIISVFLIAVVGCLMVFTSCASEGDSRVESTPRESGQTDETLRSGEIQTGLDSEADVAYYRSQPQLKETEGVYSYGEIDSLTPEIALELVMGILLSENTDLEVFLVPKTVYIEGESHYYYIFRQEWLTDWQLRTMVLDCVTEQSDYYVIELSEIILDGLQAMDSHQWTTEQYSVYRTEPVIVKNSY